MEIAQVALRVSVLTWGYHWRGEEMRTQSKIESCDCDAETEKRGFV